MKLRKQLLSLHLPPSFQELPRLDDSFLFDIETTGLSPKRSFIYLIGILFFRENAWHCWQWMVQDESEELSLLEEFFSFSSTFHTVIHFNGRHFDLPFVLERCRHHQILCPLAGFSEFDLYQNIRPLKNLLKLEKLNQKSLEDFLGIQRLDPYDGKELISLYRTFQKQPCDSLENALLLHNLEDLTGMVSLFSLLSYHALKSGDFCLEKIEPVMEPEKFQLKISLRLTHAVPVPVSFQNSYGYCSAKDQTCRFLVTGIRGSLKHFFPDCKNYDYLLLEERVIHKSLSSYVERSHRRPAKPEECYVSKTGLFLPQVHAEHQPCFQETYRSSALFFEYNDELLSDTDWVLPYIQSLFL